MSSCSCLYPIHWSQVLSQVCRCSWSSAGRRCSNYIWVINRFIAYQGVTYVRAFTILLVIESWWLKTLKSWLPHHKFVSIGLVNRQWTNIRSSQMGCGIMWYITFYIEVYVFVALKRKQKFAFSPYCLLTWWIVLKIIKYILHGLHGLKYPLSPKGC